MTRCSNVRKWSRTTERRTFRLTACAPSHTPSQGVSVAPTVVAFGLVHTVWLIAGVVALSLLAVQPFRKRLDIERGSPNRRWARTFLSPLALRRAAEVIRSHPSLPLITGIGISFSIAQACVQSFTATYLVVQHGKGLAEAGYLMAVLLAASTLSRIVLGWLADRWCRGLLLLCLLLLAASGALVLFTWSAAGPPWALLGSVALIGATSLGWTGIYLAELARVSPRSLIGDVTAAASLFGFVGSFCGSLIFALLAGHTTSFDGPLWVLRSGAHWRGGRPFAANYAELHRWHPSSSATP